MSFSPKTPDEHPPTPLPCRWPALINLPTLAKFQLDWRCLWCCATSLLPRRAHPHSRLCATPLVSVCRKCKTRFNLLWQCEWTLNVPPFWYRFGAWKKTSSSRCLTQKSAGVHGHASKLTTNYWQVWYFVLIECEARPQPDLTPVTSRRPALPPALALSPLRLSSHASVLSRSL